MKRDPEEIPHTYPARLRQAMEHDLAAVRREKHPGCAASWHYGHHHGYSEGLRSGLRLEAKGES